MAKELFTPGPWKWGDGFAEIADPSDTYDDTKLPKYADCSLVDPHGRDIIPIRIDHGQPIWDIETDDVRPNAADRALIAAAPFMYEAITRFLAKVSSASDDVRFSEAARQLVMSSVDDFQDALSLASPEKTTPPT